MLTWPSPGPSEASLATFGGLIPPGPPPVLLVLEPPQPDEHARQGDAGREQVDNDGKGRQDDARHDDRVDEDLPGVVCWV